MKVKELIVQLLNEPMDNDVVIQVSPDVLPGDLPNVDGIAPDEHDTIGLTVIVPSRTLNIERTF